MDWLQALLLGLLQGLTEYLPVSSSGHLELAKVLLGPGAEAGGLTFDIIVHVATVLSTLVILWREIAWIFRGLFTPSWNNEKRYVLAVVISMIPVAVVGVFFKDFVEDLYSGHAVRVTGVCLVITAALLTLTHFFPDGLAGKPEEKVTPLKAFCVGVAQAVAVLPGLSRSGSTIATGLLLGVDRRHMAQFSFIMVIPPILGEALLDCRELLSPSLGAGAQAAVPPAAVITGFLAAFAAGCLACKWMIALVKKCKLVYFALYCLAVGITALVLS